MSLPFTAEAFLEVFARYNAAVWPVVVALWVAAAGALMAVVSAPGERSSRLASAVLAVLWLWSGLAYHAAYFTSITVGLLLTTASRPPIAVVVVPVLWALIGGSAALVLGVATDYVLLACSGILVVDTVRKIPARRTPGQHRFPGSSLR